jgi:uncharacterized protein (TIGR02271 family)
MVAVSTKGERLGKIIHTDVASFIVEKGMFFPKDYKLRYEYVTDLQNGEVIYELEESEWAGERREQARLDDDVLPARSGLQTPAPAPRTGLAAAAVGTAGAGIGKVGAELRSRATAEAFGRSAEDIRIPLLDEEVSVEKFSRETGHVRIHKAVRTEERHLTVPVMREEIIVERSPARGDGVTAATAPFEDQVLDMAVHEEEIRVTKRPVVREEVRVRKVVHEEQREAAATLRHEECEVQETTPSITRNPAGRAADALGLGAPGRGRR